MGKWIPRQPLARGDRRNGRRSGGENRSELPRVGLDEEPPSLGDVLADAVAVLEAVPELPERVDVAKKRGSGAEGHAGSEVLVVFGAAAAVELDYGEGVERRRVGANRRLGHQRGSASSIL